MNIREPHQYHRIRERRRNHHALKRLRGLVTGLAIMVVVVVLVAYGSYAQALPALKFESTAPVLAARQVALNWPPGAQAAIGVQGQGVLSATANPKAVPTASVAKLMVALKVLDKHPLKLGQAGPSITVTQADVNSYNNYLSIDGSVTPVTLGQQISQYQALQALLLPSANNIAQMLAVWAFGSVEGYVAAANAKAQDLAMLNTSFADASGFSPSTVSTPSDLVLLGQAALASPVIKQIVAQESADFPGVGKIYNTNQLLGINQIIGLKTGNTDQAGGVYLYAADHKLPNGKQITVIGATMGSSSLWQAMRATAPLLQSFYQGFGQQLAVRKGRQLAKVSTGWGGSTKAVAAQELYVYGWLGSPPVLRIEATKLAPEQVKAGQNVGTVTAQTAYGQASAALISDSSITPPTLTWRVFRR